MTTKFTIMKRYADEETWSETTEDECLDHTEGAGYWKPGHIINPTPTISTYPTQCLTYAMSLGRYHLALMGRLRVNRIMLRLTKFR